MLIKVIKVIKDCSIFYKMSRPKNEDIVFNAQIFKGYVSKIIFDAIATNIHRVPIKLTSDAMVICMADNKDSIKDAHTLWNTVWSYKKLGNYICETEGTICVDIRKLKTMLKSVKKKESITFYIRRDNIEKLYITIQSAPTGDFAVARSETMSTPIEWEQDYMPPQIPDTYVVDKKTYEAYGKPMIITSVDFQKIKKMTTNKRSIKIIIQRNNYISFYVDEPAIMDDILEFGELIEDDVEVYEREFSASLLAPLVKLPGLCSQIEFYAPLVDNYPLRVSVSVITGLCDVTVYIKDDAQVNSPSSQNKKPSLKEPTTNTTKATSTTKNTKSSGKTGKT